MSRRPDTIVCARQKLVPLLFASIVTIVVGVGLMVQAFNSAAENSKVMAANVTSVPDLGSGR
jgi:hypothetical protein